MIDNGLKTMRQFFDGSKKFKIPEYQRAFAWEQKQIDEFFYDLFYQTSAQKYFYGTILLKEAEDEDDFSVYEIVDGQQRITTLVVFIYVLLNKIKELDPDYDTRLREEIFLRYHKIVKLVINNLDNVFFQTYILNKDINKQNIDSCSIVIDTPSQRRLLYAKDRFQELFEEEDIDLSKCLDMLKVAEKSELLIYSVSNSAEATLIFETTNDRGKRLTNLEKLKSFMMYKCFLANQKNSLETIHNLYDRFGKTYQIVEQLNLLYEKLDLYDVAEDQICQYHFICNYNWNIKKDYQNYLDILKDHINEMLRKNKLIETIEFIDNYSKSLLEYFNAFKLMLQTDNIHLKEIFYLDRIAVFYPVLLKAFYYDKSIAKENFSEVARLLAIFSFRVFGLKFKRTNDVDVFLNTEARNFNGNHRPLLTCLNQKILESSPAKRFKEKLLSPTFYYDYNSLTRNYFFWKYENYLRNYSPIMPAMPIEDLKSTDEKLIPTTEHIEAIASERDGRMTKKEKDYFEENCLHSIGNLVLDPKSSNSSKGKKKWKLKESEYYSKTPLKSQLELKSFLDRSTKSWTKNSVSKRKKAIVDFIEEPNIFEL